MGVGDREDLLARPDLLGPALLQEGSDDPSAKLFPLDQSGRQVSMLDPKTMKYHNLDTCFGTHHPQFGYDADNTLWLSGRWSRNGTDWSKQFLAVTEAWSR